MRYLKIDHEKFVQLWNQNVPINQLAKIFEVSTVTIYRYAVSHQDVCTPREGKIKLIEFAKLWNEGADAREIAKRFDINVSSVYHYAKLHRDSCPSRKRTYLKKNTKGKVNQDDFVTLWNQNVPVTEMAKILGISGSYIYKYASEHRDICPKRQLKPAYYTRVGSKIDHQEFIRMWARGENGKDMAKKLEVSEMYVYKYARKHRDVCPKRRK